MGSFKPGNPASVQDLFEQIAPRYDQLNDLLSFGLHRLWKRQAMAWLQPRPGQELLDLCLGLLQNLRPQHPLERRARQSEQSRSSQTDRR